MRSRSWYLAAEIKRWMISNIDFHQDHYNHHDQEHNNHYDHLMKPAVELSQLRSTPDTHRSLRLALGCTWSAIHDGGDDGDGDGDGGGDDYHDDE